jgi:hypothetical protein
MSGSVWQGLGDELRRATLRGTADEPTAQADGGTAPVAPSRGVGHHGPTEPPPRPRNYSAEASEAIRRAAARKSGRAG